MTGQLLHGECGSVTMFSIPDGAGKLAVNMNFLQTMRMADLLEIRTSGRQPDIIAAGIKLLRVRVKACHDEQILCVPKDRSLRDESLSALRVCGL